MDDSGVFGECVDGGTERAVTYPILGTQLCVSCKSQPVSHLNSEHCNDMYTMRCNQHYCVKMHDVIMNDPLRRMMALREIRWE